MPVSARQILSLGEGPRAVLSDRDVVLTLTYRAEGAPAGLSGIGFLLHFDSRQLSWGPTSIRRLFNSGWRGPEPWLSPEAERPEESDGDPATDQVLRFSYLDPRARWPGSTAPLPLALLALHTRPGFEYTTLRLTALSTPPGTGFEAAPLELRTPPRIIDLSITPQKVTGNPTALWWTPGDRIEIRVRFSTPVQVSGQPTIVLTLGGQSRSATYLEGSGSETLRFRYTIDRGDQGELRLDANALRLQADLGRAPTPGTGEAAAQSQGTGDGGREADGARIRSLDGLEAALEHQAPALPVLQVDSIAPSLRVQPLAAISRVNRLRLSGTVTDSGGSGVASVLLWDGPRSLGRAQLSGNRWSMDTGQLTEGVHAFRLEANDRAGNRSPQEPPLTITIDRTPPQAPQLLRPLGGADRVLSGASDDARLEGMAEVGGTVNLRLGPLLSELTTDAQGRFSWTPDALQRRQLERHQAPLTLSLVVNDRAGNSSTPIRSSLRLPQALASFGRWQGRLGTREDDQLIGSATLIDGRLVGEAVYGGGGRDTLTGLALERTDGSGWAVPLLCGGRGDDHYLVPAGSFALIADLGGAGSAAGQDVVSLAGVDAQEVALTLIDRSDLLISHRRPSGTLAPVALLLDALGRRRAKAGNRIETVQLGGSSFSLSDDGRLRRGAMELTPRPASFINNDGRQPPLVPLGPLVDAQLDLRGLVNNLATGLNNQALIG